MKLELFGLIILSVVIAVIFLGIVIAIYNYRLQGGQFESYFNLTIGSFNLYLDW